jgi:hypothetical protein
MWERIFRRYEVDRDHLREQLRYRSIDVRFQNRGITELMTRADHSVIVRRTTEIVQ